MFYLSIFVGQQYVIVLNFCKMAPGAFIGQVLRFPFPESLPQKRSGNREEIRYTISRKYSAVERKDATLITD